MAELESYEESVESAAPQKEIHLADYWAVVVKRRRLIVICLAAAVMGGLLATVIKSPRFRSKIVLDVERDGSRPVPYASQNDQGTQSEFLPSQIQLMQSREIGERVVRRLNLLADPDFNPKHYQRYRPDAKGKVPVVKEADIVDAAQSVQGLLDVTIMRNTSLVEIAASAPSPRLAAAIPNA